MAGGSYAPPMQPSQPGAFAAVPAPVLMAFAGPAKQNRLTVFFRIILAIPQLIVLAFVGIAAEIILVIGWFGALFMGRLPGFAADFLPGYLRWSARVSAYLALLTDEYPPFTMDDASYPVRVAVQPGKLNRLAVLFRIFLAIPAEIVAGVVGFGLYTIGLLVTWLIVLISGTMPTTLHKAIAAILRYQIRLNGYLLLLTSEYPWGLFGDRSEAVPDLSAAPGDPAMPGYGPPPAAPGYGAPEPGYGAPEAGYGPPPPEAGYGAPPPATGYGAGPQAPGYGEAPPAPGHGEQAPPAPGYGPPSPTPGYGAPEPGYGAPEAGYGAPAPASGAPAAAGGLWRLVLTRKEAQLVGVFAGVGVLVWVGYVALISAVAFSSNGVAARANAISQSVAAYTQLSDATRTFATTTSACQSSPQPLTCVTNADKQVAQDFGTFEQTIRGISMPSGAPATAASQLAATAGQAQRVFERLGAATSVSQYQQIAQSSNIGQLLAQLDRDYNTLGTTLSQ